MSPTTVAGHVFAQSHIPYESAPTGYGRGQTDVPSYCPCHHRFCGVFAKNESGKKWIKTMPPLPYDGGSKKNPPRPSAQYPNTKRHRAVASARAVKLIRMH